MHPNIHGVMLYVKSIISSYDMGIAAAVSYNGVVNEDSVLY